MEEQSYKVVRIIGLGTTRHAVAVMLECGHIQYWAPIRGLCPWEHLQKITSGDDPVIVGQTHTRCALPHTEEVA